MFVRIRKRTGWITLILALVGIAAALYLLFLRPSQTAAPGKTNFNSTPEQPQTPEEDKEPALPVINLQPAVNEWVAKQSGQASVVIIDLANNKTVAELEPHTKYFTASLYKLYVAYEGYRQVADGTYDMDDPYLSGYTRGECLDAMIRESHSPCAEKMWAELGKEALTDRLKSYGINDTSMKALTTTAHDAAAILQRLFDGRDLTEAHRKLYLDSMKTQPGLYRRGLPSGFSDELTVYNKVGWNGNVEWHDAAIVSLPSGRSYVVVALTQNVHSKGVAALASAIGQAVMDAD